MLLAPSTELSRFVIVDNLVDTVDKIRFFEKIIGFQPRDPESEFACDLGYLESDMNTNKIVYDPFHSLISTINYEAFLYDIESLEKFMYARLTSTAQDHIKPHREIRLSGYRKQDRKITMLSCLSNNNEYEGGELKIDIDGTLQPQIINLKAGQTVFFDSHVTWGIEPVTSGEARFLLNNAWGKSQL